MRPEMGEITEAQCAFDVLDFTIRREWRSSQNCASGQSCSVFPTYREGFLNVALEAQANRVPVVTTTATSAVESVVDGVTGLLVPVGDSTVLA